MSRIVRAPVLFFSFPKASPDCHPVLGCFVLHPREQNVFPFTFRPNTLPIVCPWILDLISSSPPSVTPKQPVASLPALCQETSFFISSFLEHRAVHPPASFLFFRPRDSYFSSIHRLLEVCPSARSALCSTLGKIHSRPTSFV